MSDPGTLARARSTVQDYYDNNTRRFLRHGQHDGTRNIHQPLWPESVESLEAAVNWSNSLVLRELEAMHKIFEGEELQVLDLGCGVGGGVFYLAERYQHAATFRGITISKVQADIARRAALVSARANCEFEQGDFLQLPEAPPVHLAYAIEAFLHASDAARFFAQVSGCLAPRARVVIIDDFLTHKGEHSTLPHERAWLADFRANWFAGSLITQGNAIDLAEAHGLRLVESEDLTPLMRLGRPRDKLIGLLRRIAAPLMQRSLYLRSLSGGYAKQQCIKSGLVEYRHLVLERCPPDQAKPRAPAHSQPG